MEGVCDDKYIIFLCKNMFLSYYCNGIRLGSGRIRQYCKWDLTGNLKNLPEFIIKGASGKYFLTTSSIDIGNFSCMLRSGKINFILLL